MNRVQVRPRRLRAGDEVAIVSPSSDSAGRFPIRVERGLAELHALGLRTRMMPHGLELGARGSATAAHRVADLHAAFADPSLAGVVCAIGGTSASELLPLLDFELIARNPKAFLGYSDITILHTAFLSHAGLVTFYGPSLLNELGESGGLQAETRLSLLRGVFSTAIGRIPAFERVVAGRADWMRDTPPRYVAASDPVALRGHGAVGILVGGCLPSLCELVGTPWEPVTRSRILLVEIPPAPYSLARMSADLQHLRNAGHLDDLAGLVTGWPDEVDDLDEFVDRLADAVRGSRVPFPVIVGVPAGHTSPMVTLPLGVRASIRRGALHIEESGAL